MYTRRVHDGDYMNTLNFRTENNGTSSKVRNAIKEQAVPAVSNAFDAAELGFDFVADKNCFIKQVGVDAITGNPVYVTLDLKVTDKHPSDRAKRKSRSKKGSTKVDVPVIF